MHIEHPTLSGAILVFDCEDPKIKRLITDVQALSAAGLLDDAVEDPDVFGRFVRAAYEKVFFSVLQCGNDRAKAKEELKPIRDYCEDIIARRKEGKLVS